MFKARRLEKGFSLTHPENMAHRMSFDAYLMIHYSNASVYQTLTTRLWEVESRVKLLHDRL